MLIVLRLKNPNIDMKLYFSHFIYSLVFFLRAPYSQEGTDSLSSTKSSGVSVTSPSIMAQHRAGEWAGTWVPFSGTHVSWNSHLPFDYFPLPSFYLV